MGSLKDEMRGLREDHQPCEKADDGVCTGGSDSSDAPEGQQLHTGQETETQGDYLPKVHVNTSGDEDRDKNPTSKDQALSGGDGGTVDQSDSKQDRILTDVTAQGDETITASLNNDATVAIEFVSDGGEAADVQGDEKTDHDKEKKADSETISVPVPSTPDPCDPRSPAPSGQQHMRTQVSLEVVQCCSVATSPMTPPEGGHSFFFPTSFGKSGAVGTETKDAELQACRQVELCSVATSPFPMTPKTPSATAFPELAGREMQPREENAGRDEGQRENVQKESRPGTRRSPEEAESEKTEALKATASKEPTEGSNSNTSPDTINCAASGSIDSQGTLEDSNQQGKQQRMGSMDQDITILVTHYANNEEEEEEKEETSFYSTEPDVEKIEEVEEEEGAAPDEISNTNHPQNKTEESSANQHPPQSEKSEVKETKDACEETKPHIPESPAPFGCHNIRTQVSLEVVQCQSAATSPMTPPEGDQAFYFPTSLGKGHSVGTEMKDAEMQVGQQVEFRSVATAPMTPRTPTVTTFPEIKKETSVEKKIVEEEEEEEEEDKNQVAEEEKVTEEKKVKAAEQEKGKEGGEKSEEKGVKKDEEEEKVMGEEDKDEKSEEESEEKVEEKGVKKDEECKEEGKVAGEEEKDKKGEEKSEERGEKCKEEGEVMGEEDDGERGEENCKEEGEVTGEEDEEDKDEERGEEPVQEVSWDEKGMTWEVYGAVVEVAVLGSAIQKHLEKQVKKQKLQASLPPPPPLNPSATPLTAETAQRGSGSGKGRAGKRGEQDGKVGRRRRNPFRQLMENMQQPHCCSRAHTTE